MHAIRSLRSDRAQAKLGRYVASVSLGQRTLGRYVGTERDVATELGSSSLRNDRAWFVCVPIEGEDDSHSKPKHHDRAAIMDNRSPDDHLTFGSFLENNKEERDVPWIVDPCQDSAQLDPTEGFPSDDATMVEPEANLEKKGVREWMQPRECIYVDATPMEGTKWKQRSIDLEDIMELDTHDHFGRARRSYTYLGELVELIQSDNYISELD
ncbi:unnamed protein product [Brassica napus]|uniref:(rape) hypothetical protein n=1 Tax=Brassica napus TaxID=3708 RepID=A0A817AW06_BRANA|nr:unnamed protein product [Brassica napus]